MRGNLKEADDELLGYRITDEGRLELAPASLARLRSALKALSWRSRGVSFERMIEQINARATGWVRYFALAHYGDAFRETDRWLRRRLRCTRLKQSSCQYSQASLPLRFAEFGLLSLRDQYAAFRPRGKPPDTLSTSGGVGRRPA